MGPGELSIQSVNAPDALRSALKSQYHAALAMFRQAIERCPDELWAASRANANPFWRVAYHTLYYTHFYLQPSAAAFRPWALHQTRIQDLDDYPAPPDIEDLCELPHRPPQTGEPYSKTQIMDYWTLCDRLVDVAIDAFDLQDPHCGFSWYKLSKLEHQLVSIRHIQHHTAQLGDRLRSETGDGVDWVGSRRGGETSKA